MNKKMYTLFLAAAVLALCMVPLASAEAGYSMAKHGKCFHRGASQDSLDKKFFHKGHFLLENAEELELLEATQDKIKDLKYTVKKSLLRQDAEIEILKIDIKRQLRNQKIDVAAVNSLVDQKYELKKAKAKMLVESLANLKGMLSDSQYEKMQSLYKEKKKH